jgi:hypothetical protein
MKDVWKANTSTICTSSSKSGYLFVVDLKGNTGSSVDTSRALSNEPTTVGSKVSCRGGDFCWNIESFIRTSLFLRRAFKQIYEELVDTIWDVEWCLCKNNAIYKPNTQIK